MKIANSWWITAQQQNHTIPILHPHTMLAMDFHCIFTAGKMHWKRNSSAMHIIFVSLKWILMGMTISFYIFIYGGKSSNDNIDAER